MLRLDAKTVGPVSFGGFIAKLEPGTRIQLEQSRVDEELRVAERTRAARQASTSRRRVARGLPPERQPGEGRGDADMMDDMEGVEVQR